MRQKAHIRCRQLATRASELALGFNERCHALCKSSVWHPVPWRLLYGLPRQGSTGASGAAPINKGCDDTSTSASTSFRPATNRTADRQARTPRSMPRGATRNRGLWRSSMSGLHDETRLAWLLLTSLSASAAASISLLTSATGSNAPPQRNTGASKLTSSANASGSTTSAGSSVAASQQRASSAAPARSSIDSSGKSSGGGRGDCGCGSGGG
mmetsp:Transcript_116071/g.335225  ORF Transcript_116071/g.335225 Transcript_116071/m.335225 type:complete len:212 (+) Transcript_116071:54-689(+)